MSSIIGWGRWKWAQVMSGLGGSEVGSINGWGRWKWARLMAGIGGSGLD